MTDRHEALILQMNDGEPVNAFYRFYIELLGHLTRSVLGLANTAPEYGNPPPPRKVVGYENPVFNHGIQ